MPAVTWRELWHADFCNRREMSLDAGQEMLDFMRATNEETGGRGYDGANFETVRNRLREGRHYPQLGIEDKFHMVYILISIHFLHTIINVLCYYNRNIHLTFQPSLVAAAWCFVMVTPSVRVLLLCMTPQ